MKLKKSLSVLLILSMILSVFVLPIGVSAESVAIEDDTFTAEKHLVDFSEYTLSGYIENGSSALNGGNVYRLYNSTAGANDRWNIIEDETATGGKYLQFSDSPRSYTGNWVPMYQCIINPTGDAVDNGDFTSKIRLESNTSYRIKLKYKISDLNDGFDVRFSAYATGGTTCANAITTANSTLIVSGLGNTDGWVTGEYVFTTPEYAETAKRCFALIMAPYSGQYLSTTTPFKIALDYVELEKLEYVPQHMEVGFESSVWNPKTGANDCYYQPTGSTHLTEWSTVTEGDNSYIQLAHSDTALSETGRYAVMMNPTGYSSYETVSQATTNGTLNNFYFIEANAKYRIRFKYKLSFTEGYEAVNIPVYMMASKAQLKSSALTNASSANGEISATDEWTEYEFVYTYDTATDAATKGLGIGFYKAGLKDNSFTLCIDDVVVDRVSTVTMVNADGTSKTVYGAPAGIETGIAGFCASEAEVIPASTAASEKYNGTTATVIETAWYEDSALTNPVEEGRTFRAADEVIFAAEETLLYDYNQMAFCGFDEYNTRSYTELPEGESEWTGRDYSTKGWNVSSSAFAITSDEAYSGTKSMKVSIASDTLYNYRRLYIGNDYELIPSQSYIISMWIKPVAVNGDLTITTSGAQGTYSTPVEGGWKTVSADSLTVGEWQRIDMMFTMNGNDKVVCAPELTFKSGGNHEFYLDTITVSALCTDTAINAIDEDSVRVTSDYNGDDTVYIAGDIYNVKWRRIFASLETDAVLIDYKSADAADVMVIDKNSDFNECYAYNEETGVRTFSGTISGLSDQPNTILNVRTAICVRKEGTTDTSVFYSFPLYYVGEDSVSYAPEEYSLVWGDEFTGTTLNTAKWTVNNEKGVVTGYTGDFNIYEADGQTVKSSSQLLEEQLEEGLLKVENGELSINTLKSDGEYGFKKPLALWTNYTMNFRYGYLEARINTPYIENSRSSLWFQSGWTTKANEKKCTANSTEVDLLETFGTYMKPNIHLWHWDSVNNRSDHLQFNNQNCVGGDVSPYGYVYTPAESERETYHIYGMKWTPTDITIYVDGAEICNYDIDEAYDKIFDMSNSLEANGYEDWSMACFQDPFCILLASGIEGDQAANIDYPFVTTVDWIRLYQKSETGTAYDGSTVNQAIWR